MLSWGLSLLLAPTLTAALSAADYYVHDLPGEPKDPLLKMHAGHIEVDPESNGNLFFWHFQNRHIANRQRTVIWLNGGPGCSSMDGALMEVGPYRLKDDHTLEYNQGSWDEFANLLFVDQPIGTGLGYINSEPKNYVHNMEEMAAHFMVFLDKFFEMFPEYERDDIYLAGESYAGQYIPYIAKAIKDRNKATSQGGQEKWPLKGLLIGNGWMSPSQYPSYFEYAAREGVIKKGTDVYQKIESLHNSCLSELEDENVRKQVSVGKCEFVLSQIRDLTKKGSDSCINVYDIRLRDYSCGNAWPPDLKYITPYLRRKDVAQALNLKPEKMTGWDECNGDVHGALSASNSTAAGKLIPGLIESGVNVLLFSGDQDLICNHIGTETYIHNMKWKDGTGFETAPGVWAPRHDWTFEGEPAGIYQHARNLTYVLFYNSSHMVPFDAPRQTRDMLDRFMNVDIASIGGRPADSRIDGEKLPQTSVGGHPNSTIAEEEEKQKIKDTEMHAYAKSGEAILVVVIIGVTVWGFFIWRSRRSHKGYRGVRAQDMEMRAGSILDRFQNKRSGGVQAGDFDESELDELHSPGLHRDQYSVGDASDDDDASPPVDSRQPTVENDKHTDPL